MNRRPTFYNWTFSQDAGSGTKEVVSEQWEAWAHIEDRSGNTFAAQATELTRYDYRVKVRYHRRYNSTTKMIYEGQYCKLEQMVIENEGKHRFLILRYSKTDTFVDIS